MFAKARSAILLGVIGTGGILCQTVAITDVTVIHPRDGIVQSSKTVVIKDRRIQAVQTASAPLSKGARIIKGTGKFLIPGLWDSHVHLTKAGEISLPLFVANGVTSVRDMGSDLKEVAEWRAQIEAGTRLGPRIKTAGQILESRANVDRMKREGTVEPVDRIRMPVGNPAEGRAAVAHLAGRGADHIKMRTTPDPDTFLAVADEARRRKVPFTAHPLAAPAELLRAGLRSVEHSVAFPPLDAQTEPQRRLLFTEMARAALFMSTTLVNIEGSILLPYGEARQRLEDIAGKLDPRRKYVCGYLVEDWREQVEENKDGAFEPFHKQLPGLYRDLRGMREAGVKFLAGTDVGVAFMYPGFSLHDELVNLVNLVGFRPLEALRIATYNPAAFYGSETEFGSITPGQSADLVLLDADPLDDIRNTRRIHGWWYVAAGWGGPIWIACCWKSRATPVWTARQARYRYDNLRAHPAVICH